MNPAAQRRLVDYTPNFFNSPALSTFKTALNSVGSSPIRIPILGSSTTEGSNANSRERRYLSKWEKLYQQRFTTSGRGGFWVGALAWGTTGTTATLSGKGLGNRSRSLDAAATTSFTYAPVTGFTLCYAEGNNAQPFEVQIDAETPITVTPATSGNTRYTGVRTFSGYARGRHTIKVTATNPCIINGAYFHDGDHASGINFINGGFSGTVATSFSDSSIYEQIGALNSKLVGLMIGSNDYANSRNPATYKSDMQGIITAINAVTTCSILLIQSYKRFDPPSPSYAWSEFGTKLQELAAENNNCLYVDISAYYPATEGADTRNLIDTDGVHQTDTGHDFMSGLLANMIV
jgi:lysophospholipase L1-like esterase